MQALPTPGKVAFSLAKRRAPWHDPSFAAALDHFIVAARDRTAVVPGVEEGWHSARVIAAIAEAARSAARVSLDGHGDGRVHLSHS
jgi:predicted dehydrogenase